ncbi:ATP-grasp domain-containing protein, partial [Bacillus spizizenii]|nr:ATP-grasp domain-containing protein [Bacillus spizizenii]
MYQSKKVLLLGSGELGKEVVIEAQRLGVQTVAVDSYEHAPAMQVAHNSYVVDMLDREQIRTIIEKEKPDLIVPEVEAIATDELLKLEEEGFHVIPNARAAKLTMDREGIRRLAAETLGLATAGYEFANTYDEFIQAAAQIGFPCVVKPLMSSSGKG